MNQSKKVSSRFFNTADEYFAFRKHWATLVKSEHKNELRAVHHLLYLIVTGKDWRKAFTLPKNTNKVENGYKPVIATAFEQLRNRYVDDRTLEPFEGLIDKEMLIGAVSVTDHVDLYYLLDPASARHPDNAYANGVQYTWGKATSTS